jgi:hypothetical protein
MFKKRASCKISLQIKLEEVKWRKDKSVTFLAMTDVVRNVADQPGRRTSAAKGHGSGNMTARGGPLLSPGLVSVYRDSDINAYK